jgi:hypothetical protein
MKATTLEPGMALHVRTTNTLSTASVQSGEAFAATLEEPIVDGTWVIAVKGSTVRGVIAHADPGGKVKGTASLSVRLTQIQTADGQNIDISTNQYGVQARSSQKKTLKRLGSQAVWARPLAPLSAEAREPPSAPEPGRARVRQRSSRPAAKQPSSAASPY